MAKATQYCVGLDNKPGTLGKLCGVLKLAVPHEPGVVERIASRLAKARINIDYMYGSNPVKGPSSTLVLSVSDVDRAAKLLKQV